MHTLGKLVRKFFSKFVFFSKTRKNEQCFSQNGRLLVDFRKKVLIFTNFGEKDTF